MRVAGGTAVGLGLGVGAFAGAASAHEVSEIEFCDCTAVTVKGVLLEDGQTDMYEAVIYCDGELVRKTLSGDQTEQSYDIRDDPTVGSDCQIIAVEGTTYSTEDLSQTFRICNSCADCADEGLGEQPEDWCDDVSTITTGTGQYGVKENTTISVTCTTGCEPEETGTEGCTPGYWRNRAVRIGAWDETSYDQNDLVKDVFDLAVTGEVGRGGNARNWDTMTLLEALSGGGGPGIEGAQKILIRAAVAALLNASHDDVDYPMTSGDIVDAVNGALDTEDRDEILSLADELDGYNNLGCPI